MNSNGGMGMNMNQNMMGGNMNQAIHVMQPSMNNMPPADDCGCDGGSTNVDVLTRNLNTNQPSQVQLVNNLAQNQQQIHNNAALNNMIAPVKQLEVQASTQVPKKENGRFCKKEVRYFLYILLALAVNEMCKFFINQSIRLNKASSNRYMFYPLLVLAVLVIMCLF